MHDQEAIEMTSSIRESTRASSLAPHDPYTNHVPKQGPEYQPLRHSTQRTTTTTLDAFWVLEIAGVIVSIACLTAIVVILFIHDGQPFSSWTFYLSLNTVISILATTSKTTVLVAVTAAISQGKWNVFRTGPHPLKLFQDIDAASRGSMGSLRAIWNLNIGFTIPFGSCIVAMSLAFQPMIQATISSYGALSDDTLQAIVGSTRNLTGGYLSVVVYAGIDSLNITSVHADAGLQTAVGAGFAASQPLKNTQLAWTCQTDNCTWLLYSSLAICTKCHDVSNLLTRRDKNGWPQAYKDLNISTDLLYRGADMIATEYSLDYANLTIGNWDSFRDPLPGSDDYDLSATEYMVVKPEQDPRRTAQFQGYESLLMAFSAIKANATYLSNLSTWQDARPSATECGLFLCLQVYNTSVKSGQVIETVVATTKKRLSSSWHIVDNITFPGQSSDNQNEDLTWNPINHNMFDYRTDYQLDASDLNMSVPDVKESFSATETFLYSLVGYLQGFLKIDSNSEKLDDDSSVAYAELDGGKVYATSALQSLFESTDLDETFANVANSVTAYLRNTGERAQKTPAQRWTIYYRVRWAFFSLPVLVVLGGTILLVISILQTHKQGLAVWKDNIIAAMVFSIDAETRSLLRERLLSHKLNDVGDLVVHMHEFEDGVELSAAPYSDVTNDENLDRSSLISSRKVSSKHSLVPSTSQTKLRDRNSTSSQALVSPISTTTLTNISH